MKIMANLQLTITIRYNLYNAYGSYVLTQQYESFT